jgi:hypothetical protein
VAAEAKQDPLGGPVNWETAELRWVELDRIDELNLHQGLAAVWPCLRRMVGSRLTLVVDAANVIGSRPDGWWKDRPAAALRLLDRLEGLAQAGFANVDSAEPAGWYPRIRLVVEGQARRIGSGNRVEVVAAPAAGDDQIVATTRSAIDLASGPVVVVTADRALADRVRREGAGVMAPGRLLTLLG